MRTMTALSRRQVGAIRRAGTFLGVSHAFVSSGLPERAPRGQGWPELAGWIKAQIRGKRGTGDATEPFFAVQMKKRLPSASPGSWLEMLLARLHAAMHEWDTTVLKQDKK
jgi:hypothetical protein